MKDILIEMLKVDHLIFRFSLYCYGMSAHLIALIDRTMPLSSLKMRNTSGRYEHIEQVDYSNIQYLMICDCVFPNSKHNFEAITTQFLLIFDDDVPVITVPESPMINAPEAEIVTKPFLEPVKAAGIEYAKSKI